MAAVPYAHIVAQILNGKHPKGTTIELAPNPKDIVCRPQEFYWNNSDVLRKIWENMNKSNFELARKKVIGFAWLAAVCFFNTIPLFIISILANLDTVCLYLYFIFASLIASQLRVYVHFLDKWANASPHSFAFISGVLPPAVSGLFGFFLPIIMRWLSQVRV